MARKNLVAVDSENEAKFRAYFEVIPAYLLHNPDIRWIQWLFSNHDEHSVFCYLYSRFGVDDRGQRQTSDPDAAKGLNRRWRAVHYKQIADAMLLNVRSVKKAVRHLEEGGFVDVVLISEGKKTVPHFCMNWDRLLSALIDVVNSEDRINKFLTAKTDEDMSETPKKKRQRKRRD